MSLQTPQLQESPNRVSSPRTAASGLMGPRPLPEKSRWETSPLSLTPGEVQAGVEAGQGSWFLVHWLQKAWTLPPPYPILQKATRSTFLEFDLFSWGVPGWSEETPASRVNFFEGEGICTLGTISPVFVYQSLDCQRPRHLGPSACKLLTRPGPAAEPARPTPPPPRPLPGTRRGSTEPSGPGRREAASLSSPLLFPFAKPLGPSRRPRSSSSNVGHRHCAPRGAPCCANPTRRWFSQGNKGQLARQPSRCGTTLFTQETVSFFPLKTNKQKNIYIYIYFFMWSCARTSLYGHSLWIPPTSS